MSLVALAGLADTTPEEWRLTGYIILFFATFVPASLARLAMGAWSDPVDLCVAAVQITVMFFMLKAIFHFLRRRGFGEEGTSWLMALAYFPVCILTNGFWWFGFKFM